MSEGKWFPYKPAAKDVNNSKSSARREELREEFNEFQREVGIADNPKAGSLLLNWKELEQSLGLEPGTLYAAWVEADASTGKGYAYQMGLLLGLWAAAKKWEHIESAPLAVAE